MFADVSCDLISVSFPSTQTVITVADIHYNGQNGSDSITSKKIVQRLIIFKNQMSAM